MRGNRTGETVSPRGGAIYGKYGYGRSPLDEDTCSLRLVREWTALGLWRLSRSVTDFTHTGLERNLGSPAASRIQHHSGAHRGLSPNSHC